MGAKNRGGGGVDVCAFRLRPVQEDAVQAVRAMWGSGQRRALLVLPTGVGKTITALEAVRRTVTKSPTARVLWLAHREELVTQPLATVQGLDHFEAVADVAGLVRGSVEDYGARVVFTSVQTMAHRAAKYLEAGPPSLIVVDEAHHYVPGRTWGDVALGIAGADEEGAGGCYVLGLTATPERADSVRLSMMWGPLPAFSISLQEAIDGGYLVPPVFHHRPMDVGAELAEAIDLANSEEGDDEDAALAAELLKHGLAEHVAEIVDGIRGAPALVFCMSVAQVEEVGRVLAEQGHRVATVTGMTPKTDRRARLAAYSAGHVDVLVNCGVLTEGTDLPRTSEIVLARPCGSKSLYIQIVGRGARLYPGKEDFRVWDVLGASKVHTLVSSVALDIGRDGLEPGWMALHDMGGPLFHAPAKSVFEGVQIDSPTGMTLLQLSRARPGFGGRPAGTFGADGPLVVPMDGWVSASGKKSLKGGPRVVDPRRKRFAWRPQWLEPAEGVRALGLGTFGMAYTVETAAGSVWPIMVPPRVRKVQPLNSRPVSMEVAAALVAEVGRHAAKVVDIQAEWREAAVTDGQRRYLAKMGVKEEPVDRGHAAALITNAKAVQHVRRFGFGPGWAP